MNCFGECTLLRNGQFVDLLPKVMKIYRLYLLIFLLSLFFSPSLSPEFNLRPDSVFLLISSPVLLLGFQRKIFALKSSYVLWSFLPLAVFISLIGQYFLVDNFSIFSAFSNFQGFLRPLLALCFFSLLIRSKSDFIWTARTILIFTIGLSLFCFIDYFHIQPFSDLLNSIYRYDATSRLGSRALGSFLTVHSAAFFFLYILIFTLSLFILNDKSYIRLIGYRLVFSTSLFSFISLILSFTKSVLISAFLVICIFFSINILKKKVLPYLLLVSITLLSFILLAPDSLLERLAYTYNSLIDAYNFIYDPNSLSMTDNTSLSNRLEWGWKNSLIYFYVILTSELNESSKMFVGDGGYFEILANNGFIGLLGLTIFMLYLFALSFETLRKSLSNKNHISLAYFLFCNLLSMFIINFATLFLKERSMVLLPLLFLIMTRFSLSSFTNLPPRSI